MDENKFCNRVMHKFRYDVELTFCSFLSKFTYSKNLKTGTIHLNYVTCRFILLNVLDKLLPFHFLFFIFCCYVVPENIQNFPAKVIFIRPPPCWKFQLSFMNLFKFPDFLILQNLPPIPSPRKFKSLPLGGGGKVGMDIF